MTIHKSAVICDTAQIAPDVEIGPNAVIGEGVIIEAGVKIGAGANIEYATIGEGTKISPMASIGGEPQDLGYKGERTGVIIGKNCWIREFATINRASGEGNMTKIKGPIAKCDARAYVDGKLCVEAEITIALK